MPDVIAKNLSILIPTFNRQEFLSVCLDSLLLQQCTGYELLVRDNDSADSTKSLCIEYEKKFAQKGVDFHYVKNPENVGFRDNMVHGLHELTRQNAMILMDDDYLINPQALASLYKSVNENTNVKLATSPVYQHKMDSGLNSAKFVFAERANSNVFPYQLVKGDSYFLNAWTKYPPLVLSSVVFDRVALLASKWEEWSERAALDVNMYNILSLQGDVAVFSDKFVAYRIHPSQDFGNLPLEDCIATHMRIKDWYFLAKETQRFSAFTLWFWRIKTVILKDQGIIKRLFQRESDDIAKYFNWLKSYSFIHYIIIKNFMPECIRHSRYSSNNKNLLANVRRQILRAFLFIYRRKFDSQYQLSFHQALKGEV
ncbi:glycosyltransferase family 2 protein [Paraglaciecola polaris]|uniref:glycosyltransferase family 2 protein n=1 Tax=Paraglaciecola polaris TaxID=222814 RepID=UPI0030EDC617